MKRFVMDQKFLLSDHDGGSGAASRFIEVHNLSKSYYRDSFEIPVLRNISLTVSAGDFVAFMGPSGSGKTTLLNLIAGLDKPTYGQIIIGGTDVTELNESELAQGWILACQAIADTPVVKIKFPD